MLDEGETIVEDRVNLPVLEGPKLYKRNGWYYIFAPIGGVERGPQAVGRARNIRGPYEWRTILEPGTTAIQGPHQGGWVETPSGQGWFAHFNSTGAFGRIVHLQPLRWVDDWPLIGEPIPGRVSGQPVPLYAMPDTGSPPTGDRLQDSDEFAAPTLGLQWSWNHNPVDTAWSLSRRPGWLRLTALPSEHLVTARNTLTQILRPARGSPRDDVRGMAEGQRAGLAMFGTSAGPAGRSGGGNRVTQPPRAKPPAPNDATHRRAAAEVGPEQTARLCLQPRRRPHLPALRRPDPARPLLLVEGLSAVAVQLRPAIDGSSSAARLGRHRLVPG